MTAPGPFPDWPEDEIAARTGLTRAQVDAAIARRAEYPVPFPVMAAEELDEFRAAVEVLRAERAPLGAAGDGDPVSPMEHESDTVRRPLAWRIHPDDAAELAAEGKHCGARRGTRRCQDLIAVVTWRWWRSAEARRVLLTERLVCEEHGAGFAARHQIEIEARPARRSTRPGTREGASEEGR